MTSLLANLGTVVPTDGAEQATDRRGHPRKRLVPDTSRSGTPFSKALTPLAGKRRSKVKEAVPQPRLAPPRRSY